MTMAWRLLGMPGKSAGNGIRTGAVVVPGQNFSNSLYDDADESEKLMNLARQPVGRVSIVNSDAALSAYAHAALDEAYRAVGGVG